MFNQEEENVPAFMRMFKQAESKRITSTTSPSDIRKSEPSPSETFLKSLMEHNIKEPKNVAECITKDAALIVLQPECEAIDIEEYKAREEALEKSEDDDEDDEIVAERKKPQCIMCDKNKAKYKCPSCEKQCCSIDCVRAHKAKFKCSGNKKVQRFIPKANFKEGDLLKDYKYLSSMILNSEKVQKKLSILKRKQSDDLRFKLLRIYSRKLHNIQLISLPPLMSRHRENTSFYFTKDKKIFWVVEFKLYLSGLTGHQLPRVITKPFQESSRLGRVCGSINFFSSDILIKYGRDLGEGVLKKIIDSQSAENATDRKLFFFVKNNHKSENISLANEKDNLAELKQEEEKSKYKFMRVDENCSIEQIFKNSTIVEFPSVHLCFSENLEDFRKEYPFTDRETG